jgi:hypothetical protein
LAKALSSGDASAKQSAATQLGLCGLDAALALPELKTALVDTNDEVRYLAACALANLGTNAQPAIPALMHATNDANLMVRRASARALQNMNPKLGDDSSVSSGPPTSDIQREIAMLRIFMAAKEQALEDIRSFPRATNQPARKIQTPNTGPERSNEMSRSFSRNTAEERDDLKARLRSIDEEIERCVNRLSADSFPKRSGPETTKP